jgi:hypothetical protein
VPVLAGFAANLLGLYFGKTLDLAGSYDIQQPPQGALMY